MAATPLWQLEQLADRPAWLNVAAVQEIVPWQVLQSCELAMCRSGLPAAGSDAVGRYLLKMATRSEVTNGQNVLLK